MPPFSQGEVQIAVIQAREGEREREREREREQETLAEPINIRPKHKQCVRIS